MLLFQNLTTAFEQLWSNKLRSLLTVLGIIIAVTSTIVVVAITQGFSSYITEFLQGLGTNAMWVVPDQPPEHARRSWRRVEMTQEDIDEVQSSCPAIMHLSPFVVRQTKINFFNRDVNVEMVGTAPEFQIIRNFYVDVGRCFGPVDIDNRRQVCVVGREVLRKLDADEGIVGRHVIINQKRFRVIGLLEKKGSFLGESMDNVVLIPYTTAIKLYPTAKRQLAFMVQATSPDDVAECKAQVTTTLRRQHRLSVSQRNDFLIFTQDEILEEFKKVSTVAASVLIGIVGISLLVGGIGIMNVMLVSVTERTREIGLRKAVGARRRDILMQFLTEATVLAMCGGIAGVAFGYCITFIASLHPSMVDISVPYWAVLLGVGFSAVVGVLFGLLPAFKAAILPPIEALRYE